MHHMRTLGVAVARHVNRPVRLCCTVRMVVCTSCACARHVCTLTGMCAEAREALRAGRTSHVLRKEAAD